LFFVLIIVWLYDSKDDSVKSEALYPAKAYICLYSITKIIIALYSKKKRKKKEEDNYCTARAVLSGCVGSNNFVIIIYYDNWAD